MKERITILLVEDSPGDADLIQELLADRRHADFQFVQVSRLAEALAWLAEHETQLILADLGLPDSSGLSTVRALRMVAGRLPLVVISGNDDEETGIAAVREGAQDYLVKGRFTGELLARVIRYALERHKTQDSLLESELRLQTILDAIRDNIMMLDTDLKILWPNQAACFAGGLSREELIGRYCYEVLRGASEPCPTCPVREAIRTGLIQADVSMELNDKIISLKGCPVKDVSGKVVGAVRMSEDITHKLLMEEQLRQAQKMETIGLLAGGIAHDFNNILSAIIGYTELAQQRELTGDKLKDYLSQVQKAGLRAKNLVSQILAFSRRTEARFIPVNLGLVVKETLKMLRPTLPMTISINHAIHEDGLVMGDPTQIHQVIMNLCINAYHAMKAGGGNLFVSLHEEETAEPPHGPLKAYLRIDIADTGIGMDENILKRLFEPYFTTKSKGEGTGLGLSVAYGIMKNHDGMIRVESAVGKGTTFHLYFPRLAESGATETSHEKEAVPGKGERILLVDDEEVLTEVMKKLLGALGYQVTVYNDPVEALLEFQKQPDGFDLVITDMTMPEMTGDVLARKLLAVMPGIPLLVCTGFSDQINEDQLRSEGIRAVLQKPLDKYELSLWIRKCLDSEIRR